MDTGENLNYFRESFRGFNRDDVAEYIAKLSKDYAQNESGYKEQIAKLQAQVTELNNKAENQKPPDISRELEEIRTLKENLDLLNSKNEKLKENLDLSELENSELKEKLRRLEEQLKEAQSQSRSEISGEEEIYKSVMEKLAQTVYSANKSAEDVIEKAELEASGIIAKAEQEAFGITAKANQKRESVDEDCKEKTLKLRQKYAFVKSEHEKLYNKYMEISEIYASGLSQTGSALDIIFGAAAVKEEEEEDGERKNIYE
ncbi:MAG: DivIVA domain-containing protein [Oscillospiraceae bacterium]|nr:DivIVA domain-containing protein [Oscillospiraceae bacterium]